MPLWYGNLNVQTHLSVHRSSSSSNYEGNLITTMLIDSLILIRATTTTKSGINSFAVHSCSPKTVSSINGWLYLPPTMSIYRLLYIGTQFKKWSFVSVSESFHPKEQPDTNSQFSSNAFSIVLVDLNQEMGQVLLWLLLPIRYDWTWMARWINGLMDRMRLPLCCGYACRQ